MTRLAQHVEIFPSPISCISSITTKSFTSCKRSLETLCFYFFTLEDTLQVQLEEISIFLLILENIGRTSTGTVFLGSGWVKAQFARARLLMSWDCGTHDDGRKAAVKKGPEADRVLHIQTESSIAGDWESGGGKIDGRRGSWWWWSWWGGRKREGALELTAL